ncbi:MAG: hypothetical protein Fur0046_01380 [Cyanobacteria bacterium J069]|nr:MAG: hypothetical protein D6742_13080 [Cyanobacteria bacterium J069]
MVSKGELQTILKEKLGINKNITESLTREDCENILALLQQDHSAARLVDSFAKKNASLGRNNAHYGQLRSQAERKLETLKTEYTQLAQSIKDLEADKQALEQKKRTLEVGKQTLEQKKKALEEEQLKLESELKSLSQNNQALSSKVQDLANQNTELTDVNAQLKKENKDLKNIVDQIRLRLAEDTKVLLQYEDSELRKAVIRLFRWTLG